MMQLNTFNVHTSQPLGVFTPMLTAGRLEVKLAENKPGTHHFNHINTDSAETYVVVKGDYNIRVGAPGGAQTMRVQAHEGDVFSVPKGIPHGDVTTQNGYRILLMETPPRKPAGPGSKLSQMG